MKAILCLLVSIGLLNTIWAGDDGKYHPELYGDKSVVYSPINNGIYDYRYRNVGRNTFYYPDHAYHPLYSHTPYQHIATPVVSYTRDSSAIPSSTILPAIVQVTPTPLPSNYVYAKHYGNEGYARIIEQDSDISGRNYQFKYKTENGISAGESGVVDPSVGGTKVTGFYEYVGADGLTYRVDYTADENGFHPTGAHLPK